MRDACMYEYTRNGLTLKRVQKRTAARLYEQGFTIYMLPCNMRIDNMWMGLYEFSKQPDETFEKIVNYYEFYNCNYETGDYAKFYVEAIDYVED